MIIISKFKKLLTCKNGATAIEYSLIAAGIALVIFTAVNTLGSNLKTSYETTASVVANSMGGGASVTCDTPDGCVPTP